jgi:hypothetical protein
MCRPLLFSLCFVGCALGVDAPDPQPVAADISAAAREYPTYRKMLAEPKSIGTQFVFFCAPPLQAEALRKKNGPHYGAYVQHYRNPIAFESHGFGNWPAGSILVKEKRLPDWGKPANAELPIAGVAGMIKRAAGTKPESGDWEFFWMEKGKITTAGMESCAGCHSGAARDYVFTTFPADERK